MSAEEASWDAWLRADNADTTSISYYVKGELIGLLMDIEIRARTKGKKSLDASFAGDPYNVWVKNTLDLLDTYKNYDLIPSEHFQFMVEKVTNCMSAPAATIDCAPMCAPFNRIAPIPIRH